MAPVFTDIDLEFTQSGRLRLPISGITLFTGPNNSGKSLILREFETLLQGGSGVVNSLKIVRDYSVSEIAEAQFNAILERAASRTVQNPPAFPGAVTVSNLQINANRRTLQTSKALFTTLKDNSENKHVLAGQLLSLDGVRLDGRTRFQLVRDVPSGDLLGPPDTIIKALFLSDTMRAEARELIYRALGRYLVIDPTFGGQLRIRLSEEPPSTDEQSLSAAARDFHHRAQLITEASDGTQAYVGIVSTIVAGQQSWVLLDEPEAFLHPPLARKLGFQLANIVRSREINLLVATHSSDFLMGCLDSSAPVRTLKLEYRKGRSRAVSADVDLLRRIYRTPLTRSANVISSLFYDGAVITESDNDRVFYSEIYHRLKQADSTTPEIIFINAQNKQTIKNVLAPLRKIGVPAAAIVDIDILKDGGKIWTSWLEAVKIPSVLQHSLSAQRDSIKKAFEKRDFDMSRGGGLSLLKDEDREGADVFCDTMDRYGLFIVRKGELENWLPNLLVPGRETTWTMNILDRLGSNPDESSYIHPSSGDVWDFLRTLILWISNPDRKGMS